MPARQHAHESTGDGAFVIKLMISLTDEVRATTWRHNDARNNQ
jgi:hypothetical protein